jgi:hypothetical protein
VDAAEDETQTTALVGGMSKLSTAGAASSSGAYDGPIDIFAIPVIGGGGGGAGEGAKAAPLAKRPLGVASLAFGGKVGIIRPEAFLAPPKGIDVKQFPEVGGL